MVYVEYNLFWIFKKISTHIHGYFLEKIEKKIPTRTQGSNRVRKRHFVLCPLYCLIFFHVHFLRYKISTF